MIENKPDIMTIMEREGLELRQRGRLCWTSCPFHEEKTPSFAVNPDRQAFCCFGCGEHGDVIDLVMKLHGLTFPEALGHLGMNGPRPKVDQREQRKRELLWAFRAWERRRLTELSHEIRQCRAIIDIGGPDMLHVTADFVEDMADAELKIDVLQNGSDEEKYVLRREENGKRI